MLVTVEVQPEGDADRLAEQPEQRTDGQLPPQTPTTAHQSLAGKLEKHGVMLGRVCLR